MYWHLFWFLSCATVHEDASIRRPLSADTRRTATKTGSPGFSTPRRLVPSWAFDLGKAFGAVVTASEDFFLLILKNTIRSSNMDGNVTVRARIVFRCAITCVGTQSLFATASSLQLGLRPQLERVGTSARRVHDRRQHCC